MTSASEIGGVVRRLTVADVGRYKEIRLRSLAESPDAFGSTYAESAARPDAEWVGLLERLDAQPGGGIWVAEEGDGRWVALAGAFASENEVGVIEIIQVWTDPSARRSGVGRRVMEAVLAEVRPHAPVGVALGVAAGNDGAVRFYESLGFAIDPTPGSACDVWMRLSPPAS